jgi:FkbM family methyltransferase
MLIKFKEIVEKYGIKPKGVIHVGGHYAEEAKDYIESGVVKSIWVEADPNHIDTMQQNIESAGFEDYSIYNECVSDKDGEKVRFNLSNNEGQSSSILDLEHHKIAHPEVQYVDFYDFETLTMDTMLKDVADIKDYTFLNADIQGAELLMLKGGTKILPNLECLYLEVNSKELYKGCGLVEEIDEFVKKYGFERVQTEWCGDFGWGDAIYIKK